MVQNGWRKRGQRIYWRCWIEGSSGLDGKGKWSEMVQAWIEEG